MLNRLAPADRKFIKEKVKSGEYVSEIEVVRDALRKLRESQNNNVLDKLILEGLEDVESGRITPYSDELIDSIFEKAKKSYFGKKTK